jgi:hypothetical protein
MAYLPSWFSLSAIYTIVTWLALKQNGMYKSAYSIQLLVLMGCYRNRGAKGIVYLPKV